MCEKSSTNFLGLINNLHDIHTGGHTIGNGHVRQGILTNGFAKAPNPNARLLSLPGQLCQQTKLHKTVPKEPAKIIHLCCLHAQTSCFTGSSKSSAERYAVSYRSFDSHDSEEVNFKIVSGLLFFADLKMLLTLFLSWIF